MSDITRGDVMLRYKRGAVRPITDEDVPAVLRALEDDPIWWCFEHDEHAGYSTSYGRWCSTWELLAVVDEENPEPIPCDIAKATRPRRIE